MKKIILIIINNKRIIQIKTYKLIMKIILVNMVRFNKIYQYQPIYHLELNHKKRKKKKKIMVKKRRRVMK